MAESTPHTRREFIRICAVRGTGLFLAAYVPLDGLLMSQSTGGSSIFSPNAFLKIDASGVVTIIIPRSEMGQGVYTSLAMLVAEELDVDWNTVEVELAYSDKKFGDQETGGSTSIRKSWEPLRMAGAAAKAMLVTAAAARWHVSESDCATKDGYVINKVDGNRLGYGELVEEASRVPVPKNVKPKDPKEYTLIGRKIHRLDTPAKVYGSALFGIDHTMPGMLYATVSHCPVFGGKVGHVDASKAKAIKGVKEVIAIQSGVAVIAESTWLAFKGREAISVEWEPGVNASVSSDGIHAMMAEKLHEPGEVMTVIGSPVEHREGEREIDAVYEVPYLAHATMEPMNCLAYWKDSTIELWAPTQNPQGAQEEVAQALNMKVEAVRVYVTLIGGGFGRRVDSGFAVQAAEISKHMGRPIKLTWTREEDVRHDVYRPPSMHHLTGTLDAQGRALTLSHHVITSSIEARRLGKALEPSKYDFKGAAIERAYKIPYMKLTGTVVHSPLPIGYWRSVYRSQNPFALESFIDEMAAAAHKDPYEFRRDMLPEDSRLRNVLILAAQKADWYSRREQGRGKGIACISAYDSYCAYVAEVTVEKNKKLHVDRFVCAMDCGLVVNPDTVEAQIQSCVAFALSAALKQRITVKNGGVVERNFDGFPILTFEEMPNVVVHIVQNTLPVGGVGELGIGGCAPALCNAIYSATGMRIRKLPIQLS